MYIFFLKQYIEIMLRKFKNGYVTGELFSKLLTYLSSWYFFFKYFIYTLFHAYAIEY